MTSIYIVFYTYTPNIKSSAFNLLFSELLLRKWVSLPSPKEDTAAIYAPENNTFDYTTFIKTILKSSADSEDIPA